VRKRLASFAKVGNEDEWRGDFIEVWAQTASCSCSESHHILVGFTILSPYVVLTAQSDSWMQMVDVFKKFLCAPLFIQLPCQYGRYRSSASCRYGKAV
jgi:hypothetical protein